MQRLIVTLTCLLAAACATRPFEVPPARVAGGSGAARQAPPSDESSVTDTISAQRTGLEHLTAAPRAKSALTKQDWSDRFPADNQLTVAINAMALKEFVQYAFGELLKVGYVIVPGVSGLEEPVTLNVQRPVSSRALYRLVAEMLEARKVGITFRDGIYYLAPVDPQGKAAIAIGFGAKSQDVPEVSGRILQVVPLRYGINISLERTIRGLVDADVQPDAQQSALFVTGNREAIVRVLDIVGLLDQPLTRAKEVGLITLTYIGSKELSEQLVTVLENEGIQVGIGRADGKNVALVPLEQLGSVVVFASSAELLARVEYWVRRIDRPSQGPEERYFVYYPKNARASDLGESLVPLLGGESPQLGNLARDTRSALGPTGADVSGAGQSIYGTAAYGSTPVTSSNAMRRDSGRSSGPAAPSSVRAPGLTMAVDPRSNSLIFYTTGLRYQSLLPMIRRLDVPPKQILLEATIAEVTLTGQFAMGVEFAATHGKWSGGTAGNLGLPGGGLNINWINGISETVKAQLSQSNTLVNVLSNPTLVVRDGVEANISVGNDVPTVGATASDPTLSTRTVTTVLYRHTGLTLTVRPTINAQGLVVMEISQQITDTLATGSSVSGAPVFFDRSVKTEVVARSGQSILLAGLISENSSDDRSRVPWISDIPILGWLFDSRTKSRSRTELVILLTPRVVDNPDDWETIRYGMQGALENLHLPGLPPGGQKPLSQSGDKPEPRKE